MDDAWSESERAQQTDELHCRKLRVHLQTTARSLRFFHPRDHASDNEPLIDLLALSWLLAMTICVILAAWFIRPPQDPTRPTEGEFTHDFAEQLRVAARQGDESLGLAPIAGARVVPVELALGPPADPVVLRVTGNGLADAHQPHGRQPL